MKKLNVIDLIQTQFKLSAVFDTLLILIFLATLYSLSLMGWLFSNISSCYFNVAVSCITLDRTEAEANILFSLLLKNSSLVVFEAGTNMTSSSPNSI